jgi:hypothetical protein
MTAVLFAFMALREILKVVLLWAEGRPIAVIAAVDGLVRTRRTGPFGPFARFQTHVAPLLAPVRRRVGRAVGLPAYAHWWALGTVVVSGICCSRFLAGIPAVFGLSPLAVPEWAGPRRVSLGFILGRFVFLPTGSS